MTSLGGCAAVRPGAGALSFCRSSASRPEMGRWPTTTSTFRVERFYSEERTQLMRRRYACRSSRLRVVVSSEFTGTLWLPQKLIAGKLEIWLVLVILSALCNSPLWFRCGDASENSVALREKCLTRDFVSAAFC